MCVYIESGRSALDRIEASGWLVGDRGTLLVSSIAPVLEREGERKRDRERFRFCVVSFLITSLTLLRKSHSIVLYTRDIVRVIVEPLLFGLLLVLVRSRQLFPCVFFGLRRVRSFSLSLSFSSLA